MVHQHPRCLFTSVLSLIMKNDISGSNSYFFNRSWTQFQQPFGDPSSQYWIDLEKLHQLSLGNCSVRFDLQLNNGTWVYADYSKFIVGNVSDKYRLNITGYSGNAGDAMWYHNGQQFTTYDNDNDASTVNNCAAVYSGCFWFNRCFKAGISSSPVPAFVWIVTPSVFNLHACSMSISCWRDNGQ